VELHHLTEYLSAKLRVYFLTSPKYATVLGQAYLVGVEAAVPVPRVRVGQLSQVRRLVPFGIAGTQ
jgi:hypothetical protein